MRHFALLACIALSIASAVAQNIQFEESRKVWLLTTSHSSYAMGLTQDGQLQHLYWGAPLWRVEDIPAATQREDVSSFDPHQMLENEEFPGWGGPRYYEPAVKITRADGNRDLVLRFVSHRIQGNELEITLKDVRDDIEATLQYRVYPDTAIISRSATIRNRTKQPVT